MLTIIALWLLFNVFAVAILVAVSRARGRRTNHSRSQRFANRCPHQLADGDWPKIPSHDVERISL